MLPPPPKSNHSAGWLLAPKKQQSRCTPLSSRCTPDFQRKIVLCCRVEFRLKLAPGLVECVELGLVNRLQQGVEVKKTNHALTQESA